MRYAVVALLVVLVLVAGCTRGEVVNRTGEKRCITNDLAKCVDNCPDGYHAEGFYCSGDTDKTCCVTSGP